MEDTHKKKRKLGCWWFLIPPVLCLLLFVSQMWGPSPQLRVSKKTTYIESHLGPDGLPNYMAFLDDRMSKGVTTENNAAVLYWKALWPGELDGQIAHQSLICKALGMPRPTPSEGLADINAVPKNELAIWIKKNRLPVVQETEVPETETQETETQEAKEETTDDEVWGDELDKEFRAEELARQEAARDDLALELASDAIRLAMETPWKTQQAPALSQWAKDNQQALDWLVEGSARSQYYSPSPNALDGSDDGVIAMLLPGVQMLRSGARALMCRAMLNLGEGRVDEAWRDIKACHQMARHVAKGWTLVEQLVGIAIDGMASKGTQALLHHGDLTVEQARAIQSDLQALPPMPGLAEVLSEGERLMYVDSVVRIASGKLDAKSVQNLSGGGNEVMTAIASSRIDWNTVLERGNEWYDRLAEAARKPYTERQAELATIEADLQTLHPSNNPSLIAGSLISSKARSELMSDVFTSLFLPAVGSCTDATDRAQVIHELNRLVAALAVYRAEAGSYPDMLDELVPGVIPKVPIDLYSGKSFIYKKTNDGFCLYSVFQNGADDGGTDFGGFIVCGQRVEEKASVDRMDSDLVVLLPLPDFEIRTASD